MNNDAPKPDPFKPADSVLSCPCIEKNRPEVAEMLYRSPEVAATAAFEGVSRSYCVVSTVHAYARMLAVSAMMAHKSHVTHLVNKRLTATEEAECRHQIEAETVLLVQQAFQQLEAEVEHLPDPHSSRALQYFGLRPKTFK